MKQKKLAKLSELFRIAANQYLCYNHGIDPRPDTELYSCLAVGGAWYRDRVDRKPSQCSRLISTSDFWQSDAITFLRSLGCDESRDDLFEEFEDWFFHHQKYWPEHGLDVHYLGTSPRQAARYTWLLFAALAAEDEGL